MFYDSALDMLHAQILLQVTDGAGNIGFIWYQDMTDTWANIAAAVTALNSGPSIYMAQYYNAASVSMAVLA